jgi:hypothetical protein
MTKRRSLFLALYIAFLCALALAIYWLLEQPRFHIVQENPFLPLIYALVAPALLGAGSIALRPIKERVDEWLRKDLDRGVCRILLFGYRGSGKTSLIRNFLAAEVPDAESSTETFDCYKKTVTYDLARGIDYIRNHNG